MDDLTVARQRLKDKKLSLVFVKDSQVAFETKTEGFAGFLQAIERLNGDLSGASVADKIVGKAAALLCAYSNLCAVFAVTLSKSGFEVLNKHDIRCEFITLVSTILNLKKTDKCPFEKLVEDVNDPRKAYLKIRRFCHPKR